jgi:hypothetical protein
VKKALQQKIRGSRDIARHAGHSSTTDAHLVADECLAIRPVLRDEGTYPLEPPGVPRYQQVPLMAASVERVRGAPPSTFLNQLARRLAVVHRCHKACEPLGLRCRWIDHMAPLLNAEPSREAAPAPRLTYVTTRRQRWPYDTRLHVVASLEKITVALTPPLLESWKPPLWPPTTHDLALFSGRLQTSRRQITGSKHTPDLMRREGRFGAMRLGLPHTHPWVDAFPHVHLNDLRHTLHLLRQTEKRRQGWHARHD